MVEEKSLKITGANKTFFAKLTTTINKILIPTKVGINGLLISSKRNSMIKAFEKFTSEDYEADERETLEKKYDDSYTAYLEALDKYVMDSVYKKVKNNTATEFEKDINSYIKDEIYILLTFFSAMSNIGFINLSIEDLIFSSNLSSGDSFNWSNTFNPSSNPTFTSSCFCLHSLNNFWYSTCISSIINNFSEFSIYL